MESYRLEQQGDVLVSGRAVGTKIGAGQARVIKDLHKLGDFKPGEDPTNYGFPEDKGRYKR